MKQSKWRTNSSTITLRTNLTASYAMSFHCIICNDKSTVSLTKINFTEHLKFATLQLTEDSTFFWEILLFLQSASQLQWNGTRLLPLIRIFRRRAAESHRTSSWHEFMTRDMSRHVTLQLTAAGEDSMFFWWHGSNFFKELVVNSNEIE